MGAASEPIATDLLSDWMTRKRRVVPRRGLRWSAGLTCGSPGVGLSWDEDAVGHYRVG